MFCGHGKECGARHAPGLRGLVDAMDQVPGKLILSLTALVLTFDRSISTIIQ